MNGLLSLLSLAWNSIEAGKQGDTQILNFE